MQYRIIVERFPETEPEAQENLPITIYAQIVSEIDIQAIIDAVNQRSKGEN